MLVADSMPYVFLVCFDGSTSLQFHAYEFSYPHPSCAWFGLWAGSWCFIWAGFQCIVKWVISCTWVLILYLDLILHPDVARLLLLDLELLPNLPAGGAPALNLWTFLYLSNHLKDIGLPLSLCLQQVL